MEKVTSCLKTDTYVTSPETATENCPAEFFPACRLQFGSGKVKEMPDMVAQATTILCQGKCWGTCWGEPCTCDQPNLGFKEFKGDSQAMLRDAERAQLDHLSRSSE